MAGGRQDSNLGIPESKSANFSFDFNDLKNWQNSTQFQSMD
jgi:hypothetical protein